MGKLINFGNSKRDKAIQAHLERMRVRGENSSGWIKDILYAAITGEEPAQADGVGEKLDYLIQIIENLGDGVKVARPAHPEPEPEADGTEADEIARMLANITNSF